MSKFIGRLLQVGVARETTRGTGVAPTYRVPIDSFSFDDKVVKAREEAGIGRIEDSDNAFVTTRYGEGDLEGEIRSSSFGLLLYAMLGTLSSASVVDSSYTHSFSIANSNQHQSLSLTVVDSNTSEMYKLAMLNELEITAELDEIVKFSAGFMSKQSVGTTQSVPALASESKFTKKHLAVKLASTIGGLAAASAISVKSLTLTISKNVVLDDVLGTAEPEDILNQQLQVEGELTLNYEDETYKNYMKNGTARAMEIKFTNTDDVIGAGSTRPSLTIQMPNVDFFDWEPNYALNEIVSQTISFKANYDIANALAAISTCQLVNGVSSY